MSRGSTIHPEPEYDFSESKTKLGLDVAKKSLEYVEFSLGKTVSVPVAKDRVVRVILSGPYSDSSGSVISFSTVATNETAQYLNDYRAEGTHKHSDIVIFLIHGVGGAGSLWKHQINFLRHKGYTVVSPDLLGHGESSRPLSLDSYEFSEIAKDVLYIFDKFKGKRNVLVGHSYGASFVTLIAKERGHFISKMVLLSGGAPTPLKPENNTVFCLPVPLFSCLKPIIIRKYRRMAFHRPIKGGMAFSLPSFVLQAIMQGQNWPEGGEEYHADLLVPVLLIYGRHDKFVTLREEQWMQETIYGSQLEVVEDAGHMVMLEKPDVVNEMILKFLNRDPSTRSRDEHSNVPGVLNNCWTVPASGEEKHAVNIEFENEEKNRDDKSFAKLSPRRTASRISGEKLTEEFETVTQLSPRRTASRLSRRTSSELSKRSKIML